MSKDRIAYGVLVVLLTVIGWMWQQNVQKLAEIETGLEKVRLDLVRIQSQLMTEERVRDLIEHEFLKRGAAKP